MKLSHLLIAVLLVAVGVMVKILCFPRPVMAPRAATRTS